MDDLVVPVILLMARRWVLSLAKGGVTMGDYKKHREDCQFKFAPLDVCDCVEKNMEERIKELEAETAEWRRQAIYHNQQHGELVDKLRAAEAKLAKAVSGFQRIAGPGASYLNNMGNFHRCQDEARTALAELGEDGDE